MKYLYLSLMILSVLASACSRIPLPTPEGDRCVLNLSAEVYGDSKGAFFQSLERESAVESLGFMVFDENGILEDRIFTEGSETVSLSLRCGYKTIWAVANMDEDKFFAVRSLSEMENLPLDLEEDFSGAFPMAGKTSLYLEKELSLTMDLSRFVCRMYVDRIISSLSEELQGKDIKIRSVFLSNVIKSCTLSDVLTVQGGATSENASWINCRGRSDSTGEPIVEAFETSCPEMTALELDRTISSGDTLSVGSCLYFMPNATLTDNLDDLPEEFSPRYTRAVSVVEIDGDIFYYVINIPLPARNTTYAMSLTIRTPGSVKPETDQYARIQDFSSLDASIWDNFKHLNFEF